jgi:hypothetical protein
MGKEMTRDGSSISGSTADDITELHRVPEDDDGRQQIHASDATMLAFARAIPDFTAPMEADGALQGMMGFAFVEADLGLALQTGVENPVDHEQGSFDTADFPKGKRQFVLARIPVTQECAVGAKSPNLQGVAKESAVGLGDTADIAEYLGQRLHLLVQQHL